MRSIFIQLFFVFFCTCAALGQGYYSPTLGVYNGNFWPSYYGDKDDGGPISLKYDYKIVLKNDSVVEVRTKINIKAKTHYISFKKNKKRHVIRPEDTKEIVWSSFFKESKGIPTDSCWLFKSFSGKITAYSYLPEPESNYIIAIQKGDDGKIVRLTKKVVMEMVADNSKALKKVEKNRIIEAIMIYNKE